jgi:hypothetical protein
MPRAPMCSPSLLGYHQQLDLGIRQRWLTGTRPLRDFTICTPFLAGPWLDHMLGAPADLRDGQVLYQAIQREAYAPLFAIPTASAGGAQPTGRGARARLARAVGSLQPGARRPAGANAGIRAALARPGRIRDCVEENLADLRARGVVPDSWVRAASPRATPAAPPVVATRLVSLELNLKALDTLAAVPVMTRARRRG